MYEFTDRPSGRLQSVIGLGVWEPFFWHSAYRIYANRFVVLHQKTTKFSFLFKKFIQQWFYCIVKRATIICAFGRLDFTEVLYQTKALGNTL